MQTRHLDIPDVKRIAMQKPGDQRGFSTPI